MTRPADPETKTDKPLEFNLSDLVPKPQPEIFTLLGAVESGVKSVRAELDKTPANQPNALMRITTMKAALVSIEALLHQQEIDTILKVQAFALGSQIAGTLNKDTVEAVIEKVENKVDGKGSGYL